jgi:hypothetical protein
MKAFTINIANSGGAVCRQFKVHPKGDFKQSASEVLPFETGTVEWFLQKVEGSTVQNSTSFYDICESVARMQKAESEEEFIEEASEFPGFDASTRTIYVEYKHKRPTKVPVRSGTEGSRGKESEGGFPVFDMDVLAIFVF